MTTPQPKYLERTPKQCFLLDNPAILGHKPAQPQKSLLTKHKSLPFQYCTGPSPQETVYAYDPTPTSQILTNPLSDYIKKKVD